VQIGRDINPGTDRTGLPQAMTGIAVAVEIVDVSRPAGGLPQIIADNVFHRAVAFGPFHTFRSTTGLLARIAVNGELHDSGPVPDTVDALDELVRLLAGFNLCLRAGDWVITGSATHIPVSAGDHLRADIDTIGRVFASII
jgi:2-keto-4-pentenoate hydratase